MYASQLETMTSSYQQSEESIHSPLGTLLHELTKHDWPILLLGQSLPALLSHAESLEPEHRYQWLFGLHTTWQRHGWALSANDKESLLELTARWNAWPLSYCIGDVLRREQQLSPANALYMMDACSHVGKVEEAIELAIKMQLSYPDKRVFMQVHRDLIAWRNWRNRMHPIDGLEWGDDALFLEPLGHQHVADFAWQYYDTSISTLCSLPRFQQDTQWHRWLDSRYATRDQRIYAVMHRKWGFIGCVSLLMHRTTGFFYYWIGRDFQGKGFGSRAVSLMLAWAQRDLGLRNCFAKVYEHNAASRRALDKLGFKYLGISGASPDENKLFYRLGDPEPRAHTINELHAMLDYMKSYTRAAIPSFTI